MNTTRTMLSNRFNTSVKKQRTCNNMVATFANDTSNAPSAAPLEHRKAHNTYTFCTLLEP